MSNSKQKTARVASSRIENGQEICNTCVRPVDAPYRYKASNGETRGCVASCHDEYVRVNTKPGWAAPKYALPKFVTETRKAMPNFERAVL